jgi:hypothetical protein
MRPDRARHVPDTNIYRDAGQSLGEVEVVDQFAQDRRVLADVGERVSRLWVLAGEERSTWPSVSSLDSWLAACFWFGLAYAAGFGRGGLGEGCLAWLVGPFPPAATRGRRGAGGGASIRWPGMNGDSAQPHNRRFLASAAHVQPGPKQPPGTVVRLDPPGVDVAETSGDVIVELGEDEALGDLLRTLHEVSPHVFISRVGSPERETGQPIGVRRLCRMGGISG